MNETPGTVNSPTEGTAENMAVSVEKLEGHQVKIQIQVGPEEVDRAFDRAYRRLAGKVNIPGFRRGKAPRPVVEGHVGSEALREEALDILLGDSYGRALEAKDLDPIDRPEVDVVTFQEGEPLTYTATVEVKPEVNLGPYTGLNLEIQFQSVGEEEVQRQLDSIRERAAELVPAEDGATLESGRFAVVDFRGTIDGQEFPGGKAEGTMVEIGAGQLEAEFEAALSGAKAGESRQATVHFPADYRNPELAGKEAVFDILVKEVKIKKVPELTPELAKELTGLELDVLRERIRQSLEEQSQRNARDELRRKVVEQVVAAAQVDLPEKMVERRIQRRQAEMAERLAGQGLSVENYLEMVGLDQEAWAKDLRTRAEHEVKRDLVLEAVAKRQNIAAADAEVEFEIIRLAASYGEKPEKVRKMFLESPGRLESLREGIIIEKTVQYLVRENTAPAPAQGEERTQE